MSVELMDKCKLFEKAFTRKRSLSFVNLTVFITNFVKKSLQLELYCFANFIKVPSITKQAFSKARQKLSPEVFKLLNDKLISSFYTDNEVRIFKGLRVLAIDSSTLKLPKDSKIREEFGPYEDRVSVPLARISLMYDVLNNITLHSVMNHYQSNDHDMAFEHINQLKPASKQTFEDLITCDRGYPSLGLLFLLNDKKKHFLIRISSTFLRQIKERLKLNIEDEILTIKAFDKTRAAFNHRLNHYLPNLPKDTTMQVRFLSFDLPNGQKEYLLTSLLNPEEFSKDVIFKLYGLRWNIEENYKFYKNIAEIQNFSGKSKIAVEQEFFGTVFACNMAALLMLEAEDELAAESKKELKYEYKINRKMLVGTIKNNIIDILMGNQNLNEYCEKLKAQIKRNLIPIRPGRSYERYLPKWGKNMIDRVINRRAL